MGAVLERVRGSRAGPEPLSGHAGGHARVHRTPRCGHARRALAARASAGLHARARRGCGARAERRIGNSARAGRPRRRDHLPRAGTGGAVHAGRSGAARHQGEAVRRPARAIGDRPSRAVAPKESPARPASTSTARRSRRSASACRAGCATTASRSTWTWTWRRFPPSIPAAIPGLQVTQTTRPRHQRKARRFSGKKLARHPCREARRCVKPASRKRAR